MDVGKGIVAGILATLIFGTLFLSYSYMKASGLSSGLVSLRVATNMPALGLAVFIAYSWAGSASFVPLKGVAVPGASGEISRQVNDLLVGYYPENSIYYAIGALSGLMAGLVAFGRKKQNFVEAAIAPVVPATMLALFAVIVGMVLERTVPLASGAVFPASAYAQIFLISYLQVAAGTFAAALIKLR